jgi:hypothetical protein
MIRTACTWLVLGLLSLALLNNARAQDLPFEDPLGDLAFDMTVVVRDLTKLSTGKVTQKRQTDIVAKLDDLIAKLEEECKNCRGGSGSLNPTKPLQDSMIVGGPGGIGDLHAPRKGGKQWAELPAHERDRILQSMTEGFPAHYQRMLERYYRQLAEEKSGPDEAADAAQPSAKEGASEPPAKSPAAVAAEETKPAAEKKAP